MFVCFEIGFLCEIVLVVQEPARKNIFIVQNHFGFTPSKPEIDRKQALSAPLLPIDSQTVPLWVKHARACWGTMDPSRLSLCPVPSHHFPSLIL